MKKIVTVSLVVFYLVITSGMFLNLHFCGDHVKKIVFYIVNDEEGCCGSEEQGDGCCKNESSFFKVKDNHHSFCAVKLTQNKIQCIEVIQPELQITFESYYSLFKETNHDSPSYTTTPSTLNIRYFLFNFCLF